MICVARKAAVSDSNALLPYIHERFVHKIVSISFNYSGPGIWENAMKTMGGYGGVIVGRLATSFYSVL